MKTHTKVGTIGGIIVVALPLISKFIIRDSISLNTQLIIILAILVIVLAIPAGVFYLRNIDLQNSLIELKKIHKEQIQKIETNSQSEIKSLKDKIILLETNREGLKTIITDKDKEIFLLRAQLALYALNQPLEVQQRIEQAATVHIGGNLNASQGGQNHQ